MAMEHEITTSRRPYVMGSNRTLTLRADQAAAYGVTTRRLTLADVGDLWVERVVGAWIVAGRLVPDDRGVPVIAELRVFPFESYRPDRFMGRWGAEVLGVKAKGVPRGGVSATFVRRQLGGQVTQLERTAAEAIAVVGRIGRATVNNGEGPPQLFKPDVAHFANELQAAGFNIRRELEFSKPPAPPRPRAATGRPAIPALNYARMAEAYAAAITGGRPLIPDLVRSGFARTPSAAKSMIARARRMGLLSAPPANGRAGGEATQAAKDLIAQSTPATKIETGKKRKRTRTPKRCRS